MFAKMNLWHGMVTSHLCYKRIYNFKRSKIPRCLSYFMIVMQSTLVLKVTALVILSREELYYKVVLILIRIIVVKLRLSEKWILSLILSKFLYCWIDITFWLLSENSFSHFNFNIGALNCMHNKANNEMLN